MAGVDPSEHERLSQRFNEAKQLYERVVLRKGHWFENRARPGHYSDQLTATDLETALCILEDLRDTLSQEPNGDDWLLHLASVHWQRAQVLFYLGRYDEATAENVQTQALIPRVPSHMWAISQKEEYWSNSYFFEGELALASGDKMRAIQSFQRSREIDVGLGNTEGIQKCDYYLGELGSLPRRTASAKVRGGRMARDSALRLVFHALIGMLASLLVLLFVSFAVYAGKLHSLYLSSIPALAVLLLPSALAGALISRLATRFVEVALGLFGIALATVWNLHLSSLAVHCGAGREIVTDNPFIVFECFTLAYGGIVISIVLLALPVLLGVLGVAVARLLSKRN